MSSAFGPDDVSRLLTAAGPRANVFLVGAGGCGMSGLGHLLLDLDYHVLGSDLVANEEVRQLQSRGAQIHLGHDKTHITSEISLVVYTSALRPNHTELAAASALGIPCARRAVLLAALLHRQRGICVAGMHGKTTTAALLSYALERLQTRPSYAVGALIPQLVPHARFSKIQPDGTIPWFVIEADESDGTLQSFRPELSILLNIDAEHLDHFANLEAISAEFGTFAQQTRGQIFFCADDPRLSQLLARNARAVSYGFHPLSSYRSDVDLSAGGQARPNRFEAGPARDMTEFEVWHKGGLLGSFAIRLIGQQNISNATAVIALLHQLGFPPREIAASIAEFRGAARRQQEYDCAEGWRVFEDYGHHPNEIRATLRALKSLHPQRLLVAFQPHRFTRTQYLWREFSTSFADADRLWLVDLYPASECEIPGITSHFLADAIRNNGQTVEGVFSVAELPAAIRATVRPGDLVLFLGAGDITCAARQFAKECSRDRLSPVRVEDIPVVRTPASCFNLDLPMTTELYPAFVARLSAASVLRQNESLAKRTTLRVGGKADFYVEPASATDLAATLKFCAQHTLPFLILGRGSNLLIRDGGLRGVVICLAHPSFSQVHVDGEKLSCGAGARLKAVAVEARRRGLSGLEFLEGIPGSLGGAMRMNAGAMGSWLFDVVESISFMDYAGVVEERRASEVNVEYRGCPLFKNHIALGAVLRGQAAAKEAILARMETFNRKRWETQPNQPSAGCIFKNPTAIPAGKLIDELGLKGTRVGGAAVSDIHANFIINQGNATARDVLGLIEIIKGRARSARGIELETEVEILGEE